MKKNSFVLIFLIIISAFCDAKRERSLTDEERARSAQKKITRIKRNNERTVKYHKLTNLEPYITRESVFKRSDPVPQTKIEFNKLNCQTEKSSDVKNNKLPPFAGFFIQLYTIIQEQGHQDQHVSDSKIIKKIIMYCPDAKKQAFEILALVELGEGIEMKNISKWVNHTYTLGESNKTARKIFNILASKKLGIVSVHDQN